jgi:8-oxo-dGTP pyrophosphatase MutT (NUDIX family)
MDKRISSRAIIIEDNSIIVLFRRRIKEDGSISEYYAIPGGGLEDSETLEENVKREIKEELSIDIDILGYLGKEDNDFGITHFFHCKKSSGIPALSGPELDRNSENNYYEIKYLKLSEISNVNIMYTDIIEKAINHDYEK